MRSTKGMKQRNFRLSLVLVLIISILCSGSVVFAEQGSYVGSGIYLSAGCQDQTAGYEDFLKDQYGIVLPSTITRGGFIGAVEKISGVKLSEIDNAADLTGMNKAMTNSEALSIAVKAAGMTELAYTYQQAKIENVLLKTGISMNLLKNTDMKRIQEFAAAADCGILPARGYSSFLPEAAIHREDAIFLLGKVLSFQGKYKNFIGYGYDADIYSRVYNSWNTQSIIEAEQLTAIVDKVLRSGAITGYNLKDERFNANFDKDLSITYGHSDIKHALQLIALLRSEGLNAKVQLEPKTSAYIYLKEWGEPVESSDFKVVKIENGNYVAYSKEYDIRFEFDNMNQKDAFQKVILKYAKKNQDSMEGLLAGSWWQPLYYSDTEIPEYMIITNNYVKKDNIIAQSFSLNEKSESVVQGFRKADTKLQVITYKFWVNEAFYNYLGGGYK